MALKSEVQLYRDRNPFEQYFIEDTVLEYIAARAIGPVAYCFNGFQSVVHFRLRKIEIHS